MNRREALRSLFAAPVVTRPESRNRRVHHLDERLYHGPLLIPADVAEALRESPEALLRTGHRHLVLRYSDGETVWVFRAAIPEHRGMVGEVVRTSAGGFRVHCLAAARPASTYRDARRFLPLVNREEPLMAADDGSCDPLYGQRMDDADLGRN